jgi:hypothetical protein
MLTTPETEKKRRLNAKGEYIGNDRDNSSYGKKGYFTIVNQGKQSTIV